VSPPFQDLKDACKTLFSLQYGTPAFSNFVVLFAPIPISIGNVDFSKQKIAISLQGSPETDVSELRMNLYGSNNLGEYTSLRHSITEFTRLKGSNSILSPIMKPDSDSTYIKLELYYKEKLIETAIKIEDERPAPYVSQTTSSLAPIIDNPLKVSIKDKLEKAKRESDHYTKGLLFEQVISQIISLVPNLKVTYTNINDRIEEIDILVRNHNREHVWADFDNIFFVECKNWTRKGRAEDIRNFLGKLRKNRRKTGIFVSVMGITGRDELEGARGEIKTTFMQDGTAVAVVDGNDLEKILRCNDASEVIVI
jgi:hypothetical protein